MGVVNVTPDSFSDGGRFIEPERAVEHGLELISQGAHLLDIGGESSRPGSRPVPEEEEVRRILPVIRSLRKQTDIPISIDTTKAAVARAALDAGVDIINDISSLRFDTQMARVVAQNGAGLILMHMLGTPLTMQEAPRYGNLLNEISTFLGKRIEEAEEAGISPESIVVDPGIGFGKTLEHNLILLKRLDVFKDLAKPLCVGVSRKAFIGKVLDLPAEERMEGTIGAAVLSVIGGAHILRVHDVREVSRAILVAEAILNASPGMQESGNTRAGYAC